MIAAYHKTRSCLDFKYIDSVFERDERDQLAKAQAQYPKAIIRMPNADMLAYGAKGIGGSVPMDWDGTIVQL